MSKNDITGDALRSRPLSPEGKANWDRIFAPKSSTITSPKKETTMPTGIFCPDCGCELDEKDEVFSVWVCPPCDALVPGPMSADDLPEAP